jgi:hypothetical protein
MTFYVGGVLQDGGGGGAALPSGCSTLVAVQDVAAAGLSSDLVLTANAFVTLLRFTDGAGPSLDGIVSSGGAFRIVVILSPGSSVQVVDYTTSASGANNRFGTAALLGAPEHGGVYAYDPTSLRWVNCGHTW